MPSGARRARSPAGAGELPFQMMPAGCDLAAVVLLSLTPVVSPGEKPVTWLIRQYADARAMVPVPLVCAGAILPRGYRSSPFVVANADPEVVAMADEVTAANVDDGDRAAAGAAGVEPGALSRPGGEVIVDLEEQVRAALELAARFQQRWGPYQPHPASRVDSGRLAAAWAEYGERLQDNYPFFHPRYAGQMLKPPHPVAIAAYLAAMTINPNNHALDGGPATGAMEKELVRELAAMFRLPRATLGHLTSSGTIANLEALWVARELHPGRAIAYSEDAHYTHARMCGVLGVEGVSLPADAAGRLDLEALERELRQRYGCRLHVDGAYGGFFALLGWADDPLVPAAPLRAIGECDSVVVDPHKHGLQPYGCGAVLFRDPGVGRLYRHDSPYTYFTSEELHLGEISLECSRAGAAAGALWLTLRALPLEAEQGLGPVLAAGVRAARAWAKLLAGGDDLGLYLRPELDIVTFFPRPAARSLAAVDAASERLLHQAMAADDPVFLSTLRVAGERLRRRDPSLE